MNQNPNNLKGFIKNLKTFKDAQNFFENSHNILANCEDFYVEVEWDYETMPYGFMHTAT